MSATASFEGLSTDEAVDRLGVDPARGLSQHQVETRLEQHGPNEIPEKEEPFIRRLLRRFWGPIPWMIEIAAVLSALVQKWEDFGIILILLGVNVFIDFRQETKALSALKPARSRRTA